MLKKIIITCGLVCASLMLSGYALADIPPGAPKGVSTESEVYKNWCAKQSAICQSYKNQTKHDRCIKRYIAHGCV